MWGGDTKGTPSQDLGKGGRHSLDGVHSGGEGSRQATAMEAEFIGPPRNRLCSQVPVHRTKHMVIVSDQHSSIR